MSGKFISSLTVFLLPSTQVITLFFFFQAEDGIRDIGVTGVQTCALPISWCSAAFSDGVPTATLGPQNIALNGNCPGLAHVFNAASNPSELLTVPVNGSGNIAIYLIAVDQAAAPPLSPLSGSVPTDARVKLFTVNLSGGGTAGGGGGGTGGNSGPQPV